MGLRRRRVDRPRSVAEPRRGAAESEADMPDRTKLGEFVPSAQPSPGAGRSRLTDAGRQHRRALRFQGQARPRQSLGHLVRAVPARDAVARAAAIAARRPDRGARGIRGPRRQQEPSSRSSTSSGSNRSRSISIRRAPSGTPSRSRGLPTSFLIDRDGKVLGRVEGAAEWDSPKIMAVLEPFLSGDGVVKASSR